jgi:hypothetical protein
MIGVIEIVIAASIFLTVWALGDYYGIWEIETASLAPLPPNLLDAQSPKGKLEAQRKIAEGEEELRKERAQKRQAMRHKASERERALDYDSAIEIWEELGQIGEAARVRKLKAEQHAVKIDQTVIHGDYVDDRDTIVKDSVISRSNIGSSSSKMQELEKLTEMKDKGAIDDDEFKQMKKEILEK